MSKIKEISSSDNKKIKELIKFRNKKGKLFEDIILIEGNREIERALDNNIEFIEVFFNREMIKIDNDLKLLERIFNYTNIDDINTKPELINITDRKVFEKICYKNNPFGIIVKAKFSPKKLSSLNDLINLPNKSSVEKEPIYYPNKKSHKPFLLIIEGIEKPGNFGALLRTADAVGVDAVIQIVDIDNKNSQTDFRNPNVIRASTGTLFSTNFITANLDELSEFLKNEKIQLIAADPYGDKKYSELNYLENINGTALVVGSEAFGLTEEIKIKADHLVKIPMKGFADSLNVNQAATIVLYEILRQIER